MSLVTALVLALLGAPNASAAYASAHFVCYEQTINATSGGGNCTPVYSNQGAWDALHDYENVVSTNGFYDAFLGYSDAGYSMDSKLIVLFFRVSPCTTSPSQTDFALSTIDIRIRAATGKTGVWGMATSISSFKNVSDWARGDHCQAYVNPYGDTTDLNQQIFMRCDTESPMPDFYNRNTGQADTLNDNTSRMTLNYSNNLSLC